MPKSLPFLHPEMWVRSDLGREAVQFVVQHPGRGRIAVLQRTCGRWRLRPLVHGVLAKGLGNFATAAKAFEAYRPDGQFSVA